MTGSSTTEPHHAPDHVSGCLTIVTSQSVADQALWILFAFLKLYILDNIKHFIKKEQKLNVMNKIQLVRPIWGSFLCNYLCFIFPSEYVCKMVLFITDFVTVIRRGMTFVKSFKYILHNMYVL